jgi:hypothetical protein
MNSPEQSDDLLCSDGDGVYDISFFAASIGHTIGQSRDVHARLEGRLTQLGPQWQATDGHGRKAYLLELHEISHHALMYSTPAGVLQWRLNQVIARDIGWIFRKLDELGISLPQPQTPEKTVTSPGWQAMFAANSSVHPGVRAYVLRTIRSLTDLLLMRSIFFGRDAARRHTNLTFGELIPLLGRCFAYLSERCEVRFVTDWRTRLSKKTLVFPPDKSFNVMDIAEVHAIAAELFALRAFGDLEGFGARRAQAEAGPFASAFAIAVAATRHVNDLGLSPHQLQMRALVSCSSRLDVTTEDDANYLEKTLPWWRFASDDVLGPDMVMDSVRQCMSLSVEKLIDSGSNWLNFLEHGPIDGSSMTPEAYKVYLEALITSLRSLGLDLQIHSLHRGLILNWRYLLTVVLESNPGLPDPPAFKRLSDQDWRSELQLAIPFLEYTDGLLFHGIDIDEVYAPDNPLRKLHMFRRFEQREFQLVAHLLNGATARASYAAYAGKLIPRSDILRAKIEATLGSATLADFTCKLMAHLFEGGAGLSIASEHFAVVPKTVPRDRYI